MTNRIKNDLFAKELSLYPENGPVILTSYLSLRRNCIYDKNFAARQLNTARPHPEKPTKVSSDQNANNDSDR